MSDSQYEIGEYKKDEFDFIMKIKRVDNIAFVKVLKIPKNWKVLIYLKNENSMMKKIEYDLKKGILWSFRQCKEPIKTNGGKGKVKKVKETIKLDNALLERKEDKDTTTLPDSNSMDIATTARSCRKDTNEEMVYSQ
ncbi:uncharacterized protein OCT59_027380 [Rhizophagus irregularis]|uniref:Uncharacterized protein n=2 Tax=Rhizophagus irregularis TaxID=588596 RepID=A0A015K456_RHIIW|nr:hypothetical protein GLOIN_2v1476993 [Rhizophagus irregularis DAOM 181602=DAOM 197198]EXX54186.1 hypothetical protein RirG_237070 [Rhizophagus irregularis DAOM 197198w]POG73374.1 hypothetical protein GLOIN_2v1476993 [Rhizophagus irregularis DAOM 181602=DAOM 197198]UZO07077.1 hypothetical protein OCT59_027380 [Rhizophagus irregularis]GBC45072.1 hypothetical protein GLOIN_2v1476993 [Rhizophagus irregularis DAOM 181602=DAOM 197198]|eukprot:XP_025180240.1 hypothetical protein GLOIN_2v1476993 [Rhizophagus irregularis DAOM 181602=DAOM 197198]